MIARLLLALSLLLLAFVAPAHSEAVCGSPSTVLPRAPMVAAIRWEDEGNVRHLVLVDRENRVYVVSVKNPVTVCVLLEGVNFQINSDILRQVSPGNFVGNIRE